jgi:hypothetical protein
MANYWEALILIFNLGEFFRGEYYLFVVMQQLEP